MNKISLCVYAVWGLLLCLSCKHSSTQTDLILQRVEDVVEQFPDSALMLLDSIRNPYELNDSRHATYLLLTVRAKDKAYQDIESDTVIFQVRDYFKKKNDRRQFVLAEFYCGRVLQSQGKTEEAMKSYLLARNEADENDHIMNGLIAFFIGELNYNQRLFLEAIPHFKKSANEYSGIKEKYKSQISAYLNIGNSFFLEDDADSAFYYYNKGLEIATLYNDSSKQADIMQNMGVAYLELGKFDLAKEAINQMLSILTDSNSKARPYLSLANVFHQENKKDSALYYCNLALALSEDNIYLKIAIYNLLSKIEEAAGNYQESLAYAQQRVDYLITVYEESEQETLLDVQKKYDFELLQNANKNLVIQRLWIGIILILFVVVAGFVFFRNHTQNKEAMLIALQQIYQLKEMAGENNNHKNTNPATSSDTKEGNTMLRTILFEHLDLFKKISLLEAYLKDDEREKGKEILKKVHRILYDSTQKFDWNLFYQPVNALHDDFLNRIKERYPALDEEEILICCLTKIGFSNIEIALLIKSNPNRKQKKKSSIREKTAMKKQDSFLKQLDEIVRKNK
jgi:tetratricopeptide (TPR) repeat protein